MPRPPGSADPDLWTLDLPPSQDTSVACMCGGRIDADGTTEEGRENEDRFYTCKLDGVQLYLVLDGHNGSRACEFAKKRLPSLLLHYNMGENGEHAAEALRLSFENTEKHFFMMLDPSITRRVGLQMEIQEQGGTTSSMAYSMFPDKVEELYRLEEQIEGGTTAVIALILDSRHLWVANVGDSRAVLCYLDASGKLHAEQISEDHNTQNEKELARLVGCGLDELSLRNAGRLGVHQNTRSIGDYSVKGGYKDHDILSGATEEPGTADPFISHPQIDITTIKGFLLLMSDGLYNAHVAVTNSVHTVNHDIACLVQRYMDHVHVIDRVAQSVVDEISTRFHAIVKQEQRSARLDDITLVIRNLGYPMGRLAVTVTAPPTVQNPFDFSQSQQQPSAGVSTKPLYENSRFLQKQFDTSLGAGYTPPHNIQSQMHAVHSRPSDMYTTNSMYSEQAHTMAHHPHPSGPNAQFSHSRQPPEFYPSSGTAPSVPPNMRKSASDPRVSLPPPVLHHGGHEVQQNYTPGAGYQGQPYSTQPDTHYNPLSASKLPPRSSPAAAVYENCEPGRKMVGGDRTSSHTHTVTSTAGVSDVTGTLGAVQLGSQGVPPPLKSMASREVTNAEFPYQTTQQGVLPPPTTLQGPVSLHAPIPNSATDWTSAADNSGPAKSTLVQWQSALDDESWMYNQDPVIPSENQPDSAPFVPPSTEDSPTGEVKGGGGEEGMVIDDGKGEGGNSDGTEVVELEFPTDDEPEKEGEEEEDGMIKPIIKFDKFPPDLSWDDI